MPVSRPLAITILSSSILMGSASIAQAHSHLPGCAHPETKDLVVEIIVNNIERQRRGLINSDVTGAELDWQIDSFSLKYITLIYTNEQTGALTCQATLHGKRDRKYWNDIDINAWNWKPLVDELEQSGHWEHHDISTMEYTVSADAEDPEYFIVSIAY